MENMEDIVQILWKYRGDMVKNIVEISWRYLLFFFIGDMVKNIVENMEDCGFSHGVTISP